jgi:hypothetical protein
LSILANMSKQFHGLEDRAKPSALLAGGAIFHSLAHSPLNKTREQFEEL